MKDILPISLLVESQAADRSNDPGVGEDAGTFNLQNEKWGDVLGRDWLQFFVAVGSILSALVVLWSAGRVACWSSQTCAPRLHATRPDAAHHDCNAPEPDRSRAGRLASGRRPTPT